MSQQQKKAYYDQRATGTPFQVGNLVWLQVKEIKKERHKSGKGHTWCFSGCPMSPTESNWKAVAKESRWSTTTSYDYVWCNSKWNLTLLHEGGQKSSH